MWLVWLVGRQKNGHDKIVMMADIRDHIRSFGYMVALG